MALGSGIPSDFHKEFAAWLRIEPRSRTDDIAEGLQARIADPLWLLGRQWQVGEFAAEDAGSPVTATVSYSTQTPKQIGAAGASPAGLPTLPLEAVVECEPVPFDGRMRIRVGQHFERFVRTALQARAPAVIDELRGRYPLLLSLDADLATQRFVKVFMGRVLDGEWLLRDARAATVATPAGVSAEEMKRLLDQLTGWYDALFVQPGMAGVPTVRAWRSQALDHRFEVNPADKSSAQPTPPTATPLQASSYRNGELDWFSFSALDGPQGTWNAAEVAVSAHPTRVSISGTARRWWELEDAAVDFTAIDVAGTDLGQLLLLEVVLGYGDDWFCMPLPLAMRSLVRIDKLTVVNSFGESSPAITPAASGSQSDPKQRWEMFSLSTDATGNKPGLNTLLLPPSSGYRQESEPLEDVHFVRDEGANLVWAVEQRVLNGIGRSVNGFDAQRERLARAIQVRTVAVATTLSTAAPAPSPESVPTYRLATTVPENWIPFLPVNAASVFQLPGTAIRLQRAQMLRNSANQDPETIPSLTRLLAKPTPLLWLEEAAVLRAGTRVQLTTQRLRWTDGKTYVWQGRKVLTGGGEGSSGLRFDVIEPRR